MSKYGEVMALLEWASQNKKEKKTRSVKYKEDDPFATLLKLKRAADEWKKFQEEQEKLNKKDDKKKDGWDSMSFVQKVCILTLTVPIVSMGGILSVLLFAKAIVRIMGT